MTREQAVKKLTKYFGKHLAYRVNREAGDADDREQARQRALFLRSRATELDERIKARERELLDVPDFQALLAERKALRAERDGLTSVLLSFRFQAGYVDNVIGAFHVEGEGDTWEQVFDQLKSKYPEGKARIA